MGIEIVTVKKIGETRQVMRHQYYCRGHGFDYETNAQSAPIRPRVHSETCGVSTAQSGARSSKLKHALVNRADDWQRIGRECIDLRRAR